jgi:hypothetical protein
MQWAWCCGCESASLNLRGSRERQQSGTKSGRERDHVLATHYLANDSEGVLVWVLLQWPIEISMGAKRLTIGTANAAMYRVAFSAAPAWFPHRKDLARCG